MDLLHDRVQKLYWKFLVPSIGGAMVVSLYNFVDTIAIGQGVGPNGTAACAVFLPLFWIAEFIGLLCGMGSAPIDYSAITCVAVGDAPETVHITVEGNDVAVEFN